MVLIYETEHFILKSHDHPEVDRLDGGHLVIDPKITVKDRTELSPALAVELMRFTIIAGRALTKGMKESWVEIWRINYQDNGNWKPELHIHLYGRAINAKWQKFGDPIIPWHREEYQSLTENDIMAIHQACEEFFCSEEFNDIHWKI